MVAYSFKRQFCEPIVAGTKRHTIRNDRKRHARPGEQLQLYYGMRTTSCKLLGRATCNFVAPIRLLFWGREGVIIVGMPDIVGAGPLDTFARTDGFADWDELKGFWLDVHQVVDEYEGVIIKWGDLHGG